MAKGFLDTVARGAGWAVLEGAKQSLTGLQQIADGVLTGVEWGARAGAWIVLEGARALVDGILDTAEGVAWIMANAAFEAAKLAVWAVLEGVEALAYNAAQLALTAADGFLVLMEGAAAATLEALEAAANIIGDALNWIKLSGLVQLNSLDFRLAAGPRRLAAAVSINIAIAQIPLRGSLDLDLSNPMNMIADFLEGQALQITKEKFPELAPFLS